VLLAHILWNSLDSLADYFQVADHGVYRLLVFRELVEGKPGGIAPNLGNRLDHVFQV
jgi:hypothetical protein